MRVQRVLMPGSEVESWTLLGEDHVPAEPVERFLAFLSAIERSPNTVKAYAHDLKDWFTFLAGRGVDWRAVTVEDVAGFVAWLRLPPAARDGRVAVLPTVEHHCTAASVNRKLAALASFCEFHSRHGVALAGVLTAVAPAGRRGSSAGSFKPFLHHVTNSGVFARPPSFEELSSGLVSTGPDVLRFYASMADGGGPVLSADAVRLMTAVCRAVSPVCGTIHRSNRLARSGLPAFAVIRTRPSRPATRTRRPGWPAR